MRSRFSSFVLALSALAACGSSASRSDGGGSGRDGSSLPSDGGLAAGWLYTSGNQIFVSNGTAGTPWMGRGVNMDDLFLCGYDATLWMTNPDSATVLGQMLTSLMTDWRPTFVRVSLAMNSYQPYDLSWSANTSNYAAQMTSFIQAIGAHPGTYVLVTLRSETSMVNGANAQCAHGSDDAVCIPTANTDAVYRSLVDTFKDAPYVLFGVSNEPGGNVASNSTLAAAMSHAVSVIRAEEDALHVPHHVVSVQGNDWTSTIGFYDSAPLPYDNVVYEYHSYPPQSSGYTQAHIPVIIGEYGPSGSDTSWSTAFYADVEAKQIPNLAWDVDTYNDCAPDLAIVNMQGAITASAWGGVVKAYLTAH